MAARESPGHPQESDASAQRAVGGGVGVFAGVLAGVQAKLHASDLARRIDVGGVPVDFFGCCVGDEVEELADARTLQFVETRLFNQTDPEQCSQQTGADRGVVGRHGSIERVDEPQEVGPGEARAGHQLWRLGLADVGRHHLIGNLADVFALLRDGPTEVLDD